MLSADLFPEHAKKFTKLAHTGMLSSVSDEFMTAIKFLVDKRDPDDILIVSNGRSRLVEGKIVALNEFYAHKDAHEMWIIYTTAAAGADVRIKKNKTPLKGLNTEALHIFCPARPRRRSSRASTSTNAGENNV